jgi:3-oxoacid CoA-transferase A subunit
MARPVVCASMAEAVADVADGSMLMIPGFGPGMPYNLLTALYAQGATNLTTVSNGVGFPTGVESPRSLGDLVEAGRVKKVIAAFTASTRPSRSGTAEELIRSGALEAELVPQGTLAERIRAGGAGIPAFYTPAGAGTLLAESKEKRTFDGREYLLEEALFADFSFIRAHRADAAGNLQFRLAARNFNPIMAMAARTTIVEVEEPIVPAGELDPDQIHVPGVYVSRLVQIPPDGIFHVNRDRMVGLQRQRAETPPGGDLPR